MTTTPVIIDQVTPDGPEQATLEALGSLIADFEGDGQDESKLTYLKHRYAGFKHREASILTGVKQSTIKRWLRDDARLAHYETQITTGNKRGLQREVFQEEYFRNYHLVMQRDTYILKKVHGLLEEKVIEVMPGGKHRETVISPPMRDKDWEEYAAMRKTYSPEAWKTIESVAKGQDGEFNIHTLILGIGQQQVNVTH